MNNKLSICCLILFLFLGLSFNCSSVFAEDDEIPSDVSSDEIISDNDFVDDLVYIENDVIDYDRLSAAIVEALYQYNNISTYDVDIMPLYEYPSSACVLSLKDSYLGQKDFYIPCDRTGDLVNDNNSIINVSGSNINGYFQHNGEEYTVTFQPYQLGRYRLQTSGNYRYLDSSDVSSNFMFHSSMDNNSQNMIFIVCTVVMCSILFLIYTKR